MKRAVNVKSWLLCCGGWNSAGVIAIGRWEAKIPRCGLNFFQLLNY